MKIVRVKYKVVKSKEVLLLSLKEEGKIDIQNVPLVVNY